LSNIGRNAEETITFNYLGLKVLYTFNDPVEALRL